MKKFNYILSVIAATSLIFTGCYTQLATQDQGYTVSRTRVAYENNDQYAQQGRDAYADTSGNYTDEYSDSTGYVGNYEDYTSSYYDEFYYSYPTYSRYFWGYYPSFSIGFSWPGWYYSSFYFGFGFGWYYPSYPYWGYGCFSYYYPAPYYYCGYNYCYNGWTYPAPYNNYYTYRERRRDITRIRNLDGLRGGGGRSILSSRDLNTGRNLTTERTRDVAQVSPATRSGTTESVLYGRKVNAGRTDKEVMRAAGNGSNLTARRPAERKSIRADANTGRINTRIDKRSTTDRQTTGRFNKDSRTGRTPSAPQLDNSRSSNGNIRPRSYTPPSVEYKPEVRTDIGRNGFPPKKSNTSKSYTPPQRKSNSKSYTPPSRNNTPKSYTPPSKNNTPKSYTPPSRNNTPKRYTPPSRNNTPKRYTPPSRNNTPRSYTPPQRSSSPPSRGSGSRSGSSSSGRSRR